MRQIVLRRDHFPKDVESYAILKQFGENVLASEGATWKLHRRVTSAAFGERNASLVFAVSGQQTRGLTEKWMADQQSGAQERGSRPVESIDRDTMKLALNIIGYVGFGLRLLWPGQKLPEGTDPRLYKYTALEPAAGHTMSFVDAVAGMLDALLLLLIVPEWLLCEFLSPLSQVVRHANLSGRIPFKRARLAAESYRNFLADMHELLDEKADQIARGEDPTPGMDIMGHLVRSTFAEPAGAPGSKKLEARVSLSRSDIIGNAFVILVAGHETTANALHFTLLELAAHPSAQRAVQRDIDRILGRETDPESWRYDETIGPLLGSMLGACMFETLRKMPSVVEIPKCVDGGEAGAQVVTVDGEVRELPGGAKISLVAVAAHRNPRYWPTRTSRISNKEHDLDDYVPERWFRRVAGSYDDVSTSTAPSTPASSMSQDSVFTQQSSADTSEGSVAGEGEEGGLLFRPERGAYLPFSDGARSCLGRRIAQVEIMAVLAVIFQQYSLELAIDDFVAGADTDEEVRAMGRVERADVYRRAQQRCRERMRGARSVLTLKMQGDRDVPVRLVRRGEERFVSWLD